VFFYELTSGGGVTHGYDAAGNLNSSSAGLQATYNNHSQMTSVTPPGGSAITMEYQDYSQDRRILGDGIRMASTQLGLTSQGPKQRPSPPDLVRPGPRGDACRSRRGGSESASGGQSGGLRRNFQTGPSSLAILPHTQLEGRGEGQ